MDESGLEWRRVVRKTTPWWNAREAIRAKKEAFKALLQNRSPSNLQSQYSEAPKTAALAVKMSKERSCEEFSSQLDFSYSSGNKVFWQTIRHLRGKSLEATTSIKDLTGNILRDEEEIL